ncbi:IclR family transcriptional regulator [Psychrobacillus insolitus]|uniref:Glycerol operon regulatory protein n=1 Tax=Psychrobacillus insolitus TaxID=1461 RepID=A0A2W7MCP3_9BACI|nr:helix-turn-helix domain-containing protein [Psychrobacillus insolitus]PZX02890.1 IclR family transcriptional regulator [Psychrobacillus insolitus]
MNMQKENYSSLENALRLMNIFTVEKPEYKLNELAEKLSIAPSTVHRLLTTLRSEGFVVKDSLSNKYRLGISLRVLESVVIKNTVLFHLSQDILEQIVLRTNLSSSLAIIFQESTFYLNAIEVDNHLFSKFSYIGKQCSFLSTSAGKVLLLSKRDTDISVFVQEQSTVSKLRSQLQTNGYIESHDDNRLGISSIAVPVKNKQNETIAALEIIGTKKQVQANIRIIEEAGINLSNKIKNQ